VRRLRRRVAQGVADGEVKDRLREIGFFRDLSDAYITQTITPRYAIAALSGGAR